MAYCAESKTCLFACELFSTPVSVSSICRFLFCVLEGWNEPWCSFLCSELLPFSLFTKRTDRMNIVYVSLSPSSSVCFFCADVVVQSCSRSVRKQDSALKIWSTGIRISSFIHRAILSWKKTIFEFVWFYLNEPDFSKTFSKLLLWDPDFSNFALQTWIWFWLVKHADLAHQKVVSNLEIIQW